MATEYITGVELEEYFVDKDTGAPLSGGYVQFWKDSDRIVPKLVFQKVTTGTDPVTGDPVYEFIPLPDPVQLSAVGTPQNAIGDNIAIYYYPFDAEGNVELYYVAVFNSLGVQQFVREGWPGSGVTGTASEGGVGADNMLSNTQFVEVLFDPSTGINYTSSGAGTITFPIAPDWDLIVTFTGVGTLEVQRLSIAGNANLETNPPYVLGVTAGSNISGVTLRQRLAHNPGIWSALDTSAGGYVAAFMLLGPNTNATMSYDPSVGAPTQLVAGNNVSAEYTSYRNTVQLDPSANTDTSATGYVDILISLSASGTSLITSIQIIGLDTDVDGINYIQEPVKRQIDHLFNYYNDLLQYKPIKSYLVGWNFPLNPAQFLGSSVSAQAVGANKSYYAWDQTIVFQSADSGLTISRDSTGALKILAAVAGKQAIVQYLPAPVAIEMLSRRKCVHVCANANVALNATVSLWYTKTSLPSTIGSNNSIVATLDANGYPVTQNGTWIPVPRSGLSNAQTTTTATNAAQFTINTPPPGAASFNNYSFAGWDMEGNVDINSATFFAIVIGTAEVAMNNYVLWQDIACQDGDIATPTAAQSMQEVLVECQYYYEKSFNLNIVPAQNVGLGNGEVYFSSISPGRSLPNYILWWMAFNTRKHDKNSVITFYNPVVANAQIRNLSASDDFTGSLPLGIAESGFYVSWETYPGDFMAGDLCAVQWTADDRLGQ